MKKIFTSLDKKGYITVIVVVALFFLVQKLFFK